MTKDEMRAERTGIIELLDAYEPGAVVYYEEEDWGFLERDVTLERIEGLRARLANLDRMLAETCVTKPKRP